VSPNSAAESIRVSASPARWFIANRVRVLVDGDATGGAYDQVDLLAPHGDMPPLHVHHEVEECFTVLEGELELYVGDKLLIVPAGESAVAPRGVPHTYRVSSPGTARALVTTSPAGFASFVLAASDRAERDGLPPEGRPVDLGRITREAAAVGIEVLGPPGMLPRDLG
jgi:mannose-6-phosphate isomerase-like protein (cupin superfamily)